MPGGGREARLRAGIVPCISRPKRISAGARVTSSIKIVGVIGSGLMGTGIAQACATAGLQVIVRDIDPAALKRCMDAVSSASRGWSASRS